MDAGNLWKGGFLLAVGISTTAWAAALTPGNVVISQVGDADHGSTADASPLHLKEVNPADPDGTIVQDILLPMNDDLPNHRCLGTSYFRDHHLKLSTNGLFLTIGGYDCPLGTLQQQMFAPSDVTTLPPRVIGRIDPFGIVDTSTELTGVYYGNKSTSGLHCVISTDGRNFWTAGRASSSGNQGIRYATYRDPTSVKLNSSGTDPREVDIFNEQLYAIFNDSGKRGPWSIGTGLPTTSGQTRTWIANVTVPDSTQSGSPYEQFWRDADTVYVTDDRIPEAMGGVNKYVRDTDSNSPTFNLMIYKYTLEGGLRPLSQAVKTMIARTNAQNEFEIFVITAEEQNCPGGCQNRLMRVVDTGCGFVPDPVTKAPTLVAGCTEPDMFTTVQTSPAGTDFRGVAFAPRACVGDECLGQCCSPGGGCQDTTQAGCAALQGRWMGLGTTCATDSCPPAVCHVLWADTDDDGDVDMDDYGRFQRCYSGMAFPVSGECTCFDRDGDGFVEQTDFNAFMACAGGANRPPGPCD